uniref:Putative mucin binding protein n=1 Tax=Limosilactobacillus reuteri subsp. suis (strain ATCC 53608 / LMG 31752 / 1063) TaxID=927703 RepID=F8KCE4_LIMR5|nr:putative mucin binding protein [Limosilactobacillus reuteri subsp. suis]
MVGKNNNYVRESKSNEHFQRFALRKLSVGVVSVAVAAGFYLGSGATAQAATTESNASAKTEQVVQQNSTSAASDSTSTSNSSAAVSTSSATPVSTESASSMTVSDLPASASAASDNQASAANASESSSQSASSSVASDAAATVSKDSQAASEANSQSAADVETVQLPTSAANANANESQAANILGAQAVQKAANQQAPAGFTVTDPNYPAEMYKDPDASHYTYWWAQSSNGEYNLVLSTDRNGDGKVYVFLLGNNNNVLGKYTVDKNKSTEVATDDEGDFGTVYNDGQSGVFVTSDGTWKSKFNVFDPKAGEDDGDYGSISFMIPQVETQTTTYVTYFDSKGNKVDKPIEVSDPVIQKGLDGQIYTTKGGKVINGYFAKEPKNAHGFMSPFGKQGAIYTKDWHDGLKATFTETDTKTGLMHVVVKHYYHSWGWGTWRTVKEFDLAPGQSEKVDYDVYKSVTIHSIYIPQTINIQYTYEKLGNLVISSDSKSFPAEDKTQYPNDKSDSTKAGNVTIPKVAGFTPTINDKTVTNYTFNPSDYVSDLSKDINVVYVADTQEAAISFYDETDHKPLNDQTIQLTGKTGEKISHTEANQTLAKLGKQGYVVDQNTFADDATYDNDTQAPQEFTIYLKHDTTHTDATSSKADQKTVSETIHYVYKDGVNANKPVADDANTTVTFKRGYTTDKVTGKIVSYDPWTVDGKQADSKTFDAVKSPVIAGYTADQAEVAAQTVTPDSQNINKTVYYTADTQEAAINFYDETGHKLLDNQTIHLTGKTGEKVDRTQADQTLADLVKQGYVLDKENTAKAFPADAVYDNNDQTPQEFTIYLKHGTTHTDATSSKADQKTVSETIHYVYKDGVNANKPVADDANTTVTFKRGYTTDKVTGKIVSYDPWTVDGKQADSKTFDAVKSPVIAGYTADQAEVAAQTVTPDSQNINKTVYYTADTQEAAINFYDETGHKLLDNQTIHLTGKTGEKVDRTQADQTLAELEKQGYVLDENNTKLGFPSNAAYDDDDVKPQEFTIYLKHGMTHTDATDKNAEQKIVTETIHYVYENNQTAKTDYTSAVDFKRGYTTDNVTHKIISYDPWMVSSKKFGFVKSPAIEGYTPNHSQIDEITVTPDSKDVVKTVVYVGNAQEAQAIFYDETTGKEISGTREIATGKTDETISFTKDPNEVVKELEKQGYVFDKDNAKNNVFVAGTAYDKNSEVHQYFKYYLKHGHATVTPDQDPQKGQKTVTQTIKYEYADGTATGLADNVQTLTFKRTGDKDLVTHEVTWPDWSTVAGQQTSVVTSPALKGYTADTNEIPAITYHAGDSDVTYVVKYNADVQHAVINYIDGESDEILHTDKVNGHSDEKINYSTADMIKQLEAWHEGYEDADGNGSLQVRRWTKAAEDQTAQVTFTRNGVLDDVTGIVAWGKWNEASQSYKALTSPTIAGYAPSEAVVKRSSNSDAEQGPTLTVIYTADAQKVHVQYIDGETDQMLRQDDLNDDKTDQTYTVIFKHHRENVDPNHSSADGTKGTKTLTETVHYKYADGTKAAEDQTAQVTFTRNGVLDDVTGIVAWGKWNEASQSYKALTSPTIAGYTPSEAVVKRSSNSDAEQGPTLTVIYTADAQTAYVKYVDDTTGETLRQDDLHGYTDETIPYSTAEGIKKYEGDGYVLVSDGFKPGTKFGVGTPTYEVHFKHGMTHTDATDKNAEQKTVTETIHYVDENNQTVQPDSTTAVTFKRGYTTDNVTGKVVSYDPWTVDGNQADSKTFAAVPSPAVEGYTPNHQQINEFTVTPDSKDIVKTVVYVGDPQEAQAIFYDETTGKEISNTREIVNGKTDETIGFTKDPNEVVKELEKQGYVFDKDNANNNVFAAGTTYDKNSEVHQYFKYYFTHATTIVTPDNPKTPADVLPDNPGKNYPSGVAKDDLNKTVTRTINITTPDGKTQTITQKAEFTRSATVDEVTGEVTYGPWSKNVVLESVDVPNISGYVPSASVPEITVTPNDQDMTINITYKKLDSGKAADQGGNASNGGQATNGGSTTGQSAQNGQSGQTQNNAGAQQLPQTGNANNEKGALGLASAMFAAGLGLGFGSKKKCHED